MLAVPPVSFGAAVETANSEQVVVRPSLPLSMNTSTENAEARAKPLERLHATDGVAGGRGHEVAGHGDEVRIERRRDLGPSMNVLGGDMRTSVEVAELRDAQTVERGRKRGDSHRDTSHDDAVRFGYRIDTDCGRRGTKTRRQPLSSRER